MEISNLIPHIEALIFASDKPLTSMEITELVNQAFGFMEDKIVADQDIAASVVRHTDFEQSEVLAVSDEGELIGGGEGEREREGERGEKAEGEEGYVNGHTFEGMEVDYGEETPADEEIPEEDLDLIGDSSFEENEEEQSDDDADRKTGDEDENEDEPSSESTSSTDEKE
jgi:hypothetical protein